MYDPHWGNLDQVKARIYRLLDGFLSACNTDIPTNGIN